MSNIGLMASTGLFVSQCAFSGNMAGIAGGAIYAVGVDLYVTQVSINLALTPTLARARTITYS